MAKLIGPLHSAEARGRVSGLIYNTWRGISYAKAFCAPAQPRTKIQLRVRAMTTQLVRAWQGLTQDNRDHWNAYAAEHPQIDWTGNPKRLSGLNWYLRCNFRILYFAETLIDDPPAVPGPDPVTNFAAADGVLESILTWVFPDGAANRFWVFTRGPHSQGITASIEHAAISLAGTAAMGTITATGLSPGRYTFSIQVVNTDTGLVSTFMTDHADITAA